MQTVVYNIMILSSRLKFAETTFGTKNIPGDESNMEFLKAINRYVCNKFISELVTVIETIDPYVRMPISCIACSQSLLLKMWYSKLSCKDRSGNVSGKVKNYEVDVRGEGKLTLA